MKNEVELIVIRFYADLTNKKLHVPRQVIEAARDLSSVEARLYFERLHRYPGFEVIVVRHTGGIFGLKRTATLPLAAMC